MNTQELRKLKSLDELYAEIDQLREDAARYQWLKENLVEGVAIDIGEIEVETLDAAIDAAMKEQT